MKLRDALAPLWVAIPLISCCGLAHAQAFDAVRLYGVPEGDGEGSAGAALVAGHQYQGSNEARTLLFPLLDYRWTNGWFAGTTNGIGYVFASPQNVQYGLRVTADLGRSQSRSTALNGLGDIPWRPEFGGFFNLYLSREIFLTSSLRYGQGEGHDGLLLDLGAGYATQLATQWRLALGVATTLANAHYMQDYFGISPSQAQTSGYLPYQAGAGFRDTRVNAALNYFVTSRWSITGAISLDELQGDAKDSPIVRDRHPVSGVAAVNYRF